MSEPWKKVVPIRSLSIERQEQLARGTATLKLKPTPQQQLLMDYD
jgi:hypothetical protein